MAKTNILKYETVLYNKAALETGSLTEKQMRAEYSRLRKIANRRIEALGRSRFSDTQAYLRNVGQYPTLSKLTDIGELEYKLHDLARFVTAKGGSVTGQYQIMKQTIETFRDMGLTFINEKNYKSFTDFMEWSRTTRIGRILDSSKVQELFGVLEKHRIDPDRVMEDFSRFETGNIDDKVNEIISASINGADAKTIRKLINNLKKK